MKNFDIDQWNLTNAVTFMNKEHIKLGYAIYDIGVNMALLGLAGIITGQTMLSRGRRYNIDLLDDTERNKLAEVFDYYKGKYTKKN